MFRHFHFGSHGHESPHGRFHEFLEASGRHRHGRHSGHFGWGRGGGSGGFGGDDFPRGRQFTSDNLQLLLLNMIAEQSRHGYELIKELDARSNGFYSPSPGMVYPALTYLEELGYVTVQVEGNRKRYELSPAGREYLERHREHLDHMLERLKRLADKMDVMRRAFSGEYPRESDDKNWIPELVEARHALKRALHRHGDLSAEEQRRIADILARAAAEIDSKK
jgi:DNA-binding PadR family transcriptional regulator